MEFKLYSLAWVILKDEGRTQIGLEALEKRRRMLDQVAARLAGDVAPNCEYELLVERCSRHPDVWPCDLGMSIVQIRHAGVLRVGVRNAWQFADRGDDREEVVGLEGLNLPSTLRIDYHDDSVLLSQLAEKVRKKQGTLERGNGGC